jgi:hypothetical protein
MTHHTPKEVLHWCGPECTLRHSNTPAEICIYTNASAARWWMSRSKFWLSHQKHPMLEAQSYMELVIESTKAVFSSNLQSCEHAHSVKPPWGSISLLTLQTTFVLGNLKLLLCMTNQLIFCLFPMKKKYCKSLFFSKKKSIDIVCIFFQVARLKATEWPCIITPSCKLISLYNPLLIQKY